MSSPSQLKRSLYLKTLIEYQEGTSTIAVNTIVPKSCKE